MRISNEQLISLATEMNNVMGLEPPIDVTDITTIKESITTEMVDIYPEDSFTEEAWGMLSKLGCQVAIDRQVVEEPKQEQQEDFEPYTEAELYKFNIEGLRLICSDFGQTTNDAMTQQELIGIIIKAQNKYLNIEEQAEEAQPELEYIQKENDKEYPDGTKKHARNGDKLYAGYTKKELNLMKTLTLKKLLKERFAYEAEKTATKEELIEYVMNLDYVPRSVNEQEIDYLYTTKQVNDVKVAKITKARSREDCCVQALTEEDEDIDKALEKAIEYYHIGGGNQGSNPEYYMRAAMNTVLSVLCASTEESIEQAKRFRPTFKMKAYKKGE